jgi:hypothetical protein
MREDVWLCVGRALYAVIPFYVVSRNWAGILSAFADIEKENVAISDETNGKGVTY